METEYIRDYAMYTAIFGRFSFVWFGWAQENPRKKWRKYIGVAPGIAFLVCLIGVYLISEVQYEYILIAVWGEFA